MSTKQKIGAFIILAVAFVGSGIAESYFTKVDDATKAHYEEVRLSQ